MKAIIISSLLFFSLRAMSATVNEDKKGDCKFSPQKSRSLEPKNVTPVVAEEEVVSKKDAAK